MIITITLQRSTTQEQVLCLTRTVHLEEVDLESCILGCLLDHALGEQSLYELELVLSEHPVAVHIYHLERLQEVVARFTEGICIV